MQTCQELLQWLCFQKCCTNRQFPFAPALSLSFFWTVLWIVLLGKTHTDDFVVLSWGLTLIDIHTVVLGYVKRSHLLVLLNNFLCFQYFFIKNVWEHHVKVREDISTHNGEMGISLVGTLDDFYIFFINICQQKTGQPN